MGWGVETDADTARAQLGAFLDAGGTTVDTAVSYGEGRSEAILGSMIGDVVARSEVVLVSKAGISHRRGRRMVDTSRRAMLAGLDATLARLRTDHLDLWLTHVWDDNVPLDETLSALELAVTTGRVRYAGVSNYNGWQLARAATLCDAALVANQVEYSLLQRGVEHEVVPAAEHMGSGLLAWAPLGRGVLTGKYRRSVPTDSRGASKTMAGYVEPYLGASAASITEALATAAKGLDRQPLDVALSWLLAQNNVAGAIVGPRTIEQLEQILASSLEPLPEQIAEVLEEVSATRR